MDDDAVRLIHGDCLEVMATMEPGSVDAIVTDPPWKDYETGRYDASRWHKPVIYVSPDAYSCLLFRALREDSAIILWCNWESFEGHASALRSAGFIVRNCIIWGKPNHTAGDLDGNLGYQHESAVFAVKGHWKRHGPRQTNLWLEPHLFSRTRRDHPTEKPLRLIRRAVELVCPPGDLVLDPFAGSGTTLVACQQTGRRGVGIEIDGCYVEVARRRLDGSPLPLFDGPAGRVQATMFPDGADDP